MSRIIFFIVEMLSMEHRQLYIIDSLKRLPLLVACGVFCLWTNFAIALDVERVVWGFDGQVVSYRFNLLSVEVANNDSEAFDGVLELWKTSGSGPRTGG